MPVHTFSSQTLRCIVTSMSLFCFQCLRFDSWESMEQFVNKTTEVYEENEDYVNVSVLKTQVALDD